jgi:hypothetical protein
MKSSVKEQRRDNTLPGQGYHTSERMVTDEYVAMV